MMLQYMVACWCHISGCFWIYLKILGGPIGKPYPECEGIPKSVAFCAALHIHNVLIRGAQHKSMVKSLYLMRWLHPLVNSLKVINGIKTLI